MRIAIFGMGYVGVVSGACLLKDGHEIVGVDPVDAKIVDLSKGFSPVQEARVSELLAAGHKTGQLKATTQAVEGLKGSDMVWICVGTQSSTDGAVNLSSVETVTQQIGRALRQSENRPLIVLRSTCLPGTTANIVIPMLERESGLTVGKDIHVVFHPEFLREGSAVEDFYHPPKIVIGEAHAESAEKLLTVYKNCDAPIFRLELTEAEMVKYYDNLFHALKITFANEVAAVAESVGVDARRIADVFCADTKLNISPRYLQPGPAFGGSCLPKDLRAVLRFASIHALQLPLLQGVLESNDLQIERLISKVLAYHPRAVGMVGLAFKPGTDDMRESPYVRIAKALIGEGIKLRIYDSTVRPDKLIGSNKEQVQKALRHLEQLLVGSLDDLSDVDLIIVNHAVIDADCISSWLDSGICVFDIVGIEGVNRHDEGYEGIYW